jgi:hypothetical protein
MKTAIIFGILLAAAAPAAWAQAQSHSGQTAGGSAVAAPPPVSRKVKGRTLTSAEAPRVRIDFDKAFRYAGGQSFVLYDVANAEQHFFVDANADGRVRRLYWVQFEGYLPSNDKTYNYTSPNVVRIGGLDFIADAQARRIPAPDASLSARPANKISDGDHARAFLASKGFKLASDQALWQRLVHMVDASKRSELMIIYLEDLGGTGLTAADLSEGGRAVGQWASVSKGLLERARKGMTISVR